VTAADVQATRPRPATRDHLRSLKKPATKYVTILLDPDALDAFEKAQERLGESTSTNRRERERELTEARNALAEATVTMKFQSLGRKRYEALVAEHPPTPEQNEQSVKETEQEAAYNIETFPKALIRATCVDPELTDEDIDEIYDSWNGAELMELFFAALEVNTQRRTVDLGNVFGPTVA
jgi:hypothetical protein